MCGFDVASWNVFMDEIDQGFYTDCIFVLTSNLSKSQIDEKFDANDSLLRDGRVHLIQELIRE
jgi:hypothetical protein